MRKSQLLIILTLWALLVLLNQFFTEASSLRRYLGGLPWFGWAGISVFIAFAGILFALRDARRARQLLEEPIEKYIDEDVRRVRLSKELLDKYDLDGPDYPHPVIIEPQCIGCQACVDACPHNVLAMVGRIAAAVRLVDCMEDTACQVACPVDACIVVNTTKIVKPRPVPARDKKTFMTNVPGCYLIGDVSGTPLIKNAANEGADVINHIAQELTTSSPEPRAEFDVAIVGIGPAGLSAAVIARRRNLKYIGIEQDKVLSTIEAYPKEKYIFFSPRGMEPRGAIAIAGAGDQRESTLESWLKTMVNSGVQINERERCQAVKRADDGDYFTVQTEKRGNPEPCTYTARRVVLALGNRGAPMKLRVPGEQMKISRDGRTENKVMYVLSHPDDFKGRKMLVVGGGNSAVEAAVDLVARRHHDQITFRPPEEINEVALAVRNGFTNDVRFGNKLKLYHCIDEGRIKLYWDTSVKEVRAGEVVLMDRDTQQVKATVANDYVLALLGADHPRNFLKSIGITIPES
jgi:thioredoxin reductase (NADPH)